MEFGTLLLAALMGVLGLLAGILAGVMPGLNAAIGIAVLLPFTFGLDPVVSLIFLGAVFTGGIYGGAITAILINVPGSPSNIATAFDGYAMARAGKAQDAIYLATIAHATGGVIGVLVLLLVAPPLAQFALRFGPAESFWTYMFGLTIVASLSPGTTLKGAFACLCGLLLSTVGLSPLTGVPRFHFGMVELFGGISLLAALIGLFGFSEAVSLLLGNQQTKHIDYRPRRGVFAGLLAAVYGRMYKLVAGSATIGLLVGLLPGAGASIAALLAYAEAKSFSGNRQQFGKGAPEGVVASESANSACVGGDLIPTLTLGIPGSPAAAVMVGGLIIHGLVPGPALFTTYASITYNFIYGMLVAQVLLIPLGCWSAGLGARMLAVKPAFLGAAILVLCVFGTYAATSHLFGMLVMLFCGFIGVIFKRAGIPIAPLVLGLILGGGIEDSFLTSLQLGEATGSILAFFFTRPIAIVLIILCAVSFFASMMIEHKVAQENLRLASAPRSAEKGGLLGLAALLISGVLFLVTLKFDGGERARMFPQLVLALMAIVGLTLLVRGVMSRRSSEGIKMPALLRSKREPLILLASLSYPFLAYYIGFYSAAFAFMSLFPWLVIKTSPQPAWPDASPTWRRFASIVFGSAAFVLFLYVSFWQLLRLPVPSGQLFSMLP